MNHFADEIAVMYMGRMVEPVCDQCMHSEPELIEVEPEHWVACHLKK